MAGAKRSYKPITGSLVDDQVELKLAWTSLGGAGAIPVTANMKKNGISSVTRTAAGKFDIVLTENYSALKAYGGGACLTQTGSASGNATVTPYAWTPANAGGSKLSVAFHLAGTLSDLTAGDTFMVDLDLSRSNLEPGPF